MAFYVDTSAAVKLVIEEAGSKALRRWVTQQPGELVSCDLMRTELSRAVRRSDARAMEQVRAVLDAFVLMSVPTALFERAGDIEPIPLRTLDAIHIAAALEIGDELDGLVTFDDRMAEAAQAYGISVVAPR